MGTWLRWSAMALLCTQFAACALRPGSQNATPPAQAMGNTASSAAPADGAAVAAELGYHGPVRRSDSKPAD
jgi:hypothetical protein